MTTSLLGEYAAYVPHPDDSEEHREKLRRLAFGHRIQGAIDKAEDEGLYEVSEHLTSQAAVQ